MTSLNPSTSGAPTSPTNTENQLTVYVTDEQDHVQLDATRYEQLARSVLNNQGINQASELSVLFVSPETIAELNEQHMGHTGPTDVLAFPIDEDATQPQAENDAPLLLGDVVVCPAVAATNCLVNKDSYPGHQGTLTDELDLLVVHGILHVLGMDHAESEERRDMQALERQHLSVFRGREL